MTKVQIKRSSTSGATPTTLSPGELAANVNDGRLWVGGDSGAPMEIGAKTPTGSFTVRRASTVLFAGLYNVAGFGSAATVQNQQYFIPIIYQRELTIKQLLSYVNTAKSATFSIGLYDTTLDANGYQQPGALIASVNGIDASTIGLKQYQLAQNITLLPNKLYWASMIADSYIDIRFFYTSGVQSVLGCWPSGQAITYLYAGGVGSVLPATAPTILQEIDGNIPMIGLIEA